MVEHLAQMTGTTGKHTSNDEPEGEYDYAQRMIRDAKHITDAKVMSSILSAMRGRLVQITDPAQT